MSLPKCLLPAMPLAFVGAFVLSAGCSTESVSVIDPDKEEWVELFNGQDLSGWTIKIANFPAGENAFNTFRVEDGLLKIRYDDYTEFNNHFGHIFSNHGPYSHYRLQVEYRFVGEQVPGGPEWAKRNNGMMYHAQSPHDMSLTQWFPTCMEYQLLGGDGEIPRTTANLCTPDTNVVIDGELRTDHCMNSTSKTFHGDQWVTAELLVHGSELAQHRVQGELVMEYNGLQLDDGTPLSEGFIALQAESHPTDFRSVRLLNLEGCMDEAAKNFKSYFVKNNAALCHY
jgi:hypothetical protein